MQPINSHTVQQQNSCGCQMIQVPRSTVEKAALIATSILCAAGAVAATLSISAFAPEMAILAIGLTALSISSYEAAFSDKVVRDYCDSHAPRFFYYGSPIVVTHRPWWNRTWFPRRSWTRPIVVPHRRPAPWRTPAFQTHRPATIRTHRPPVNPRVRILPSAGHHARVGIRR